MLLDSEKVWTIGPNKVKLQDRAGILFVILNLVGLSLCFALDPAPTQKMFHWFRALDASQWIALLLPAASTLYFVCVHHFDINKQHIGGLSSQSETSESKERRSHEYADSGILRQSIHALLAAALIAGLIPDSKDRCGGAAAMATASIAALAVSTAFSLVSVLCYGYSKRWKTEKPDRSISRSLLNRGFYLDKLSWYTLIVGLVWLPGIWYPFASVLTNLVFGCSLFVYYFDRAYGSDS